MVSRALSLIFIASSAIATTACNSPDTTGTDFSAPASTVTTTAPTSASAQQNNVGNTLVLISGDQQTSTPGSSLINPIVAKVLDPNGLPVVGVYVLVTVASGGGSVSNQTPISDTNGEVVFQWTLGTALDQDILNLSVYSDLWVNGPDLTLTANRTVGGEAVLNSTIVGSGPVVADGVSTSHITITLLDSNGQALTGVVPTFSATGTNTYFPCTAVNSEGVSHCLMTSLNPGSKTLSVATPIAFPGGLVQFNPGAPKYLTVSGDNGSLLSVVVKDANNNVIPNQQIDWTVTFGGGTLSAASISSDATGTASNTYTSASSGTQSITASVHGYATQVPSVTFILNYGVWTFQSGTASSSYILGNNNIDFTAANVCELTNMSSPDNTLASFTAGTAAGITYGTLSDGVSQGFKIDTTAGELNSSWTPEWSSIVAVWHLDDLLNVSTLVDSSGKGNGGTPTNVTLGQNGQLGTAGMFNTSRTSSIVTSTATALSMYEHDFTVQMWVNPSTGTVSTGGSWGLMGNLVENTNQGLNFQISGQKAYLGFWGNDTQGNITIPENQWTQIVFRYTLSTGEQAIFVNGAQDVASTGHTSFIGTDNMYIGRVPWGANFVGEIDEFAVWSKPLTNAEILTIYNKQGGVRSGTFTSRVMDSLQAGSSWTSLSWVTTLPFFKALPDNAVSETIANYSSLASSTLMSGIVGLWHLDETSGFTIADHSGHGNNGTAIGVTLGAAGKFGTAATFNGSSYISLPSAPLALNTYTYSLWFKTTSTGMLMGESTTVVNSGTSGYNPFLYVGTNGYLYGGYYNGMNPPLTPSSTKVNDGQWHFAVQTATLGGTQSLYLDGKLQSSGNAGNACGPYFYVGTGAATGFSGTSGNWFYFTGSIDEVAAWSRVLSPTEILQLYQRGISRVKFQVQTCAQSNCSDGTFQGPDGTSATYFSELDNTTSYNAATNVPSGNVNAISPTLTFANFATPTPAPNRYFQYRATLETDSSNSALMPELKSVTIGPNHYDPSSPTIVGLGGVASPVLTSFVQTLGANGCATATYNLGIGTAANSATWYYWNTVAGAWSVANGTTAKSNSAAVINTNIVNFPTIGASTVYVKAFLNSNGNTPCELKEVQLNGHN